MAKNIRLTIGEFSKFCQVTVKTLKHYEKLGLLVPNEVDEWSHYRYYDVSQMRQLNGILRLKSMGFSLEEIHDLFDEGTHKPSIPQIEEKIQKVENDINTLQDQLTTLQSMAESQKKLDGMGQFSIQSLPAASIVGPAGSIDWRNVLVVVREFKDVRFVLVATAKVFRPVHNAIRMSANANCTTTGGVGCLVLSSTATVLPVSAISVITGWKPTQSGCHCMNR